MVQVRIGIGSLIDSIELLWNAEGNNGVLWGR